MKRILALAMLFLVYALAIAGSAVADTKAPSSQQFQLTCGGNPVTFVSPVGPAEAAQIVGGTGVGILQEIVSPSGDVLFQHQSSGALNPNKLTTCSDGDGFTYIILVTPQHG